MTVAFKILTTQKTIFLEKKAEFKSKKALN